MKNKCLTHNDFLSKVKYQEYVDRNGTRRLHLNAGFILGVWTVTLPPGGRSASFSRSIPYESEDASNLAHVGNVGRANVKHKSSLKDQLLLIIISILSWEVKISEYTFNVDFPSFVAQYFLKQQQLEPPCFYSRYYWNDSLNIKVVIMLIINDYLSH